jgi:hypothetical protein
LSSLRSLWRSALLTAAVTTASVAGPAGASGPLTVDFSDGYTFRGVQRTIKTGAVEAFVESPIGPFTLDFHSPQHILSWNRGEQDDFLDCNPAQAVHTVSESITDQIVIHFSVDGEDTPGVLTQVSVVIPSFQENPPTTTSAFPIDGVDVDVTIRSQTGTVDAMLARATPPPGAQASFVVTLPVAFPLDGPVQVDLSFTGQAQPALGPPQTVPLGCPPPNENLVATQAFGVTQLILENTFVVLSFASVGIPEARDAAEPGVDGEFTVRLTGPLPGPATIDYSVGGSAAPGVDYQALPGSLIIPAGQTAATIPVVVIDDDLVEGDETVVVDLSGASYAFGTRTIDLPVGSPATATVTIVDDDDEDQSPACAISSPPGDVTIAVGQSVSFGGSVNDAEDGPLTPQWSFPGGAPASSSAGTVSVTYAAIGEFTATLSGTDSSGQSCAPATRQIRVVGDVVEIPTTLEALDLSGVAPLPLGPGFLPVLTRVRVTATAPASGVLRAFVPEPNGGPNLGVEDGDPIDFDFAFTGAAYRAIFEDVDDALDFGGGLGSAMAFEGTADVNGFGLGRARFDLPNFGLFSNLVNLSLSAGSETGSFLSVSLDRDLDGDGADEVLTIANLLAAASGEAAPAFGFETQEDEFLFVLLGIILFNWDAVGGINPDFDLTLQTDEFSLRQDIVIEPVPEPSALALGAASLAALGCLRRRRLVASDDGRARLRQDRVIAAVTASSRRST